MKALNRWLPWAAAAVVGWSAVAGSTRFVCGLTGKESDRCCCERKDGKLVCQNTGKTVVACCCKKN